MRGEKRLLLAPPQDRGGRPPNRQQCCARTELFTDSGGRLGNLQTSPQPPAPTRCSPRTPDSERSCGGRPANVPPEMFPNTKPPRITREHEHLWGPSLKAWGVHSDPPGFPGGPDPKVQEEQGTQSALGSSLVSSVRASFEMTHPHI